MLLMAGVGYAMSKGGIKLETESLGRLVLMVGTPSLVFSSLTSPSLPQMSLTGTVSAAVFTLVFAAILSAGLLYLYRQPIRAFLPSLTMPNSGNFGLPVVMLAFDQEGLAVGIAFFFVVALVQYTVVPAIMIGEVTLRRILKEPLIYSLITVAVFRVGELTPHPIISKTTEILGAMVIPVMVILLGYSVAQLKVSDLRLSILLGASRLGVGICSGLVTVYIFGLSGIEAGSAFLMASMPCAIIIYLFAIRYNRAPRRIAGIIVVSTAMTFLALPVLLWIGIGLSTGTGPFALVLRGG